MRRAVLLLALTLTAGCSQVDALAPVGGTREATVRFAGNDVLVERGVAILTAPVCQYTDGAVSCAGRTVDGQDITVTAPAGDPATMTVTVGTQTLYSGPVATVVEQAGRPS